MEDKLLKEKLLIGKINYNSWFQRWRNQCLIQGWLLADKTNYSVDVSKVKQMKEWLLDHIANSAMDEFDASLSISDALARLSKAYGLGGESVYDIMEETKQLLYFNPKYNPNSALLWLTKRFGMITAAGGTLSEADKVRALICGLDDYKYHSQFWFQCRGNLNMLSEDSTYTFEMAKTYLAKYWRAFSTKEDKMNDIQDVSFYQVGQRQSNRPSANEAVQQKRKRTCDYCSNPVNGRLKVKGSHTTGNCFYGNVPGFNKANSNHVDGNKSSDSAYFYDSGTTPISFTNEKPIEFIPKGGWVYTAGKNTPPIRTLGTGKLKFGDVEVDAIYCPEFSKTLISGIDLMKKGYTSTIKADKIIISKDDKILADGRYDGATGLLKMNTGLPVSNRFTALMNVTDDVELWHSRLGHVSENMVIETAKAADGITLKTKSTGKSKMLCDPCMKGKLQKRPTPKVTKERPLMDTISGDEQGPFRIPGFDGSKYNVKFIEKKSRWMKMFNIPDITAQTLLENFKPWLTRLENRTGLTLKNFHCDQSFDGVFLDYLEEKGIVKLVGEPYDHHTPGQVENANKNVMAHARAMLIDSKLPNLYYSEAQLCAVYLHNRTVHSNDTITPYEHIFKRKPDLSHLKPFGCHGYILVKKEIREKPLNLSKISPTGLRCRLLGYADDDETEEMKGWKVLVYEDASGNPLNEPYIEYSRHCVWDESKPMSEIPQAIAYDDFLDFGLFGDSEYTPSISNESEEDEADSQNDEGANTPQLLEPTDESEEPSDQTNLSFLAQDPLLTEKFEEMTNIIRETYNGWWETKLNGISPETIMYAFLALQDGIPVPTTYKEAINGPESKHWKKAMDAEVAKIRAAGTIDLQHISKDECDNIVECRWVFKKKLDLNGNVKEYKARLVAKGFTQKYGIDFFETFAPVAKLKSVRLLTQIAASQKLVLFQDDAPSAFLNGELKERIIMQQIPGYDDGTGRLCVLKKTLYGLKQSPREWNQVIDAFLKGEGFKPTVSDPCIYIKQVNGSYLICAVYVDDIITGGKDDNHLHEFRKRLHKRFNMSEGGPLELYLGCHFERNQKGDYSINQEQYLLRKLTEFDAFIGKGYRSSPLPTNFEQLLENSKDDDLIKPNSFPYREMVGSLMYAMVATRPDLAQPLSIVSKFMSKPKQIHCDLLRHIYMYVRGTTDFKLLYTSNGSKDKLHGYVDASYANNEDSRSTSGFCFKYGTGLISWYSKKQPTVALSSAEAEYIAATEAAKEGMWLRVLLSELGFPQDTTQLYEDNQACILLSKNPQLHSRTKHILPKYHYIREKVSSGDFNLVYTPTKEQPADIFTKGIAGHLLRPHLTKLGCSVRFKVKG